MIKLLPIAALASLCFAADTRFEISNPVCAMPGGITGRVYVMISHVTSPNTPARSRGSKSGASAFRSSDAISKSSAPGQSAIIDATDLGTPVVSLSEIPPGEYWVQAFVNVYSEFKRADGHAVWMHDDQWEGQRWNRSPGNLYSAPQKITLDAAKGYRIPLVCDQVIPPVQPIPPTRTFVKRFRIQSPMLTKFWGRPIYLGATVLLPRDYDKTNISYPVLYEQGHFSLAAPMRFEGADNEISTTNGCKDDFPRMIVVTMQHPNPYFDDSYAVNSVNVGPYGDAIHAGADSGNRKAFPHHPPAVGAAAFGRIDGRLGIAGAANFPSRFLRRDVVVLPGFGGFFGRRRRRCLSRQERVLQRIRVAPRAHHQQPRDQRPDPADRRKSATVSSWSTALTGRSGEQLDIWSAVFGPLGEDGYFDPLWDKKTGVMNPRVARVLEGTLRSSLSPGKELVDAGAEAGGQTARVRRRRGQFFPEQRDAQAAGVDEEDRESALRRLVRVRRGEGALLQRSGERARIG